MSRLHKLQYSHGEMILAHDCVHQLELDGITYIVHLLPVIAVCTVINLHVTVMCELVRSTAFQLLAYKFFRTIETNCMTLN